MATKIKTPTRTIFITLTDSRGIDWSGDYIGNHADEELHRADDGYIADDDVADWWVHQCAMQQQADDAINALPRNLRKQILADSRINCDLVDQPYQILSMIEELA